MQNATWLFIAVISIRQNFGNKKAKGPDKGKIVKQIVLHIIDNT
jgi:hypothetical protein